MPERDNQRKCLVSTHNILLGLLAASFNNPEKIRENPT